MRRDRKPGLFKYPDLRRKILFTIGVLIVFRLLVHIPVMQFDHARLNSLIRDDQYVFAWDMQSGGALATLSVLSLGLAPHFAAQGILYSLTRFSASLQETARYSRDRYKRYQHLLAIPLALVQIILLFGYLQRTGAISRFSFHTSGLLYLSTKAVVLIAGSFFVGWLADRITEDGIGEGFPILVFGGVAARLPYLMADLFRESVGLVIFVLVALIAALFVSIIVSEGQRRVSIQYPAPRRSRPLKRYGTGPSIPIRVNRVGTGPLEASLALIATLAFVAIPVANLGSPNASGLASGLVELLKGTSGFWILYVLGTLFYALIYQDMVFDGHEVARSLAQQGAMIPGIRKGEATGRYLETISNRVGLIGILYLGSIAIFPYLLGTVTGMESVVFDAALAALLGFDTVLGAMRELQAQLALRSYEGFVV